MISDKVKEIAEKIGLFYLQKNKRLANCYDVTDQELLRIQITRIEIDKVDECSNRVTIYTSRPGLLIGKRGENIGNLSIYLGCMIRVIEEDSLFDCMRPTRPDEYDF